MSTFLDHVRRKSGIPGDFSDDDDDDDLILDEPTDMNKTTKKSKMRRTHLPRNRKAPAIPRKALTEVPMDTIETKQPPPVQQLTEEDIELCQRLDEEYERALEEREVGYNARYASVRQSAVLSVFFMVAFLSLGTAFFIRQAAWTVPEAILFSIYAITTVGYGRDEMPTTPGFQAYTIFFILVGIAALTIMVAQVYQCIALEASRAQHARDRTEMRRRGLDVLQATRRWRRDDGAGSHRSPSRQESNEIIDYDNETMPHLMDSAFRVFDKAKNFFRYNEFGRGLSVVFPFAGLILLGAMVVGPIEGWTFLESLYFAVVSLTTVGFGDYVPRQTLGIWFTILWLPFSVGFMSMYLGNVAAFYIRLSDRNVKRIERHMRKRLQRAKEKAERERAEVLKRAYRGQEIQIEAVAAASETSDLENQMQSSKAAKASNGIPLSHAQSIARHQQQCQEGFNVISSTDGSESDDHGLSEGQRSIFGSSQVLNGQQRRQRIIENSTMAKPNAKGEGPTIQSMRDVVRAVRTSLDSQSISPVGRNIRSGPERQFMSIKSTQAMVTHSLLRRGKTRKPSFALRVLVQERFAEIIATDIAGFQSNIEIKDTTLIVTIDSLMQTADKWLIPRRARKPFRAVAFEALSFVGERGLVTRGVEALFDLSPFEFHGLFGPLIAAMGDADTMESWLSSTDVLAAADLPSHNDDEPPPPRDISFSAFWPEETIDEMDP